MTSLPRIGAVVLTYNSVEDFPASLDGLSAQEGVDLRVIVVDNASRAEGRAEMEAVFKDRFPGAVVLNATRASADQVGDVRAVFVRNERNVGYSAGNNIGARLAAELGCDAVLIANPDIRIENRGYVAGLYAGLEADAQAGVAASSIINLANQNENPMQEPVFVQEILWPLKMIVPRLGLVRKEQQKELNRVERVEKVSGSCFLITVDTLQKIGFFDDAVFLYCEEAILAARLKKVGRRIVFIRDLEVRHCHDTSAKGDIYLRYKIWSRSRAYYHRTYSGYGELSRLLLAGSRGLILGLVRGRQLIMSITSKFDFNRK